MNGERRPAGFVHEGRRGANFRGQRLDTAARPRFPDHRTYSGTQIAGVSPPQARTGGER